MYEGWVTLNFAYVVNKITESTKKSDFYASKPKKLIKNCVFCTFRDIVDNVCKVKGNPTFVDIMFDLTKKNF